MNIDAFVDNSDIVDDSLIWVYARVEVLSTQDGGRSGPFANRYRPNHNFGGPENRVFYIGEIVLEEDEKIYPGETREILIRFINVQDLKEFLMVGRSWRIQEGGKLVANAEVISRVERDT